MRLREATVRSATLPYFVVGVIGVAMFVALAVIAIYQYFVSPPLIAIAVSAMITLPLVFVASLVGHLPMFFRSSQFTVYYAFFDEDNVDMKFLKENYYVGAIDKTGVIFVKKEDRDRYIAWSLYQLPKQISDIEASLKNRKPLFTVVYEIGNILYIYKTNCSPKGVK